MNKTSVYLNRDEAEGLRRVSVMTGRSQAELIREGVRRVIAAMETEPRVCPSMSVGHGGGTSADGWSAEGLYEWAMGRR
jgi:hypothetical protein